MWSLTVRQEEQLCKISVTMLDRVNVPCHIEYATHYVRNPGTRYDTSNCVPLRSGLVLPVHPNGPQVYVENCVLLYRVRDVATLLPLRVSAHHVPACKDQRMAAVAFSTACYQVYST